MSLVEQTSNLDALEDSLEWHADHETLTHYSVLNACRSWRYAEKGVWSSKEEAAEWARSRTEDPTIIDSALAIRQGDHSHSLDLAEVRAFVLDIKARVEHAPHRYRIRVKSSLRLLLVSRKS